MSILDIDKFDATPLQREPCDYIVVPEFVKREALAKLNADFPSIARAGNFPLEGLSYGPGFQSIIDEMQGPEVRRHFSAKFGMGLESFPTQITIRRYMSPLDGNIHNDSRAKKITVLIYFNETWTQKGGQLRITRAIDTMDDYYVEVPPVLGALIAFRRNEHSFHGFPSAEGERRTLQMYWVDPKRLNKKKSTGLVKAFHKVIKRTFGKAKAEAYSVFSITIVTVLRSLSEPFSVILRTEWSELNVFTKTVH
jgi:SM-20-related protein